MATTVNEDGSKKERTNKNKGHVATGNVPRFQVTDADKKYKTPAWDRWEKGNPNYYYNPGKGKA